MARFGLPPTSRVQKSDEYRRILKGGRRVSTPHFTLFYKANRSGRLRLGITVSKKVGKAHARNRLKRWVREYFRQEQYGIREAAGMDADPPWCEGLDLVFLARGGAADIDHQEARRQFSVLVNKATERMRRERVADRNPEGRRTRGNMEK